METLKYKLIRNKEQYEEYCNQLEQLVFSNAKTKEIIEEIDLLTLLIKNWDNEHNSFSELDPIRLLKSLMEDKKMKAKDLVDLLSTSKGYVSDILNHKKGLSKEVIRKLSEHFKVAQEAFNRPYKLLVPETPHIRKSRVMNREGTSF